MDLETYNTERVDHLAMVAQFIDDIGMVDLIDGMVEYHENEIVTTGQAAAAMVSLALGFVSRPMYLSPQFFSSKALRLIIGKSKTNKTEEITPEHLNDDKLGRTLDAIYKIGPDTLFQTIAFKAARLEGLSVPSLHLDTTTHSFHGEYESETSKGISNSAKSGEPCEVQITYGFSKDHRQDCKQLVQELLVSQDGDVPLMAKVHSGNESDTKIFQERVKELKEQFKNADDLMPEYIVADSKFYNETNVTECSIGEKPFWVTRVPWNIKETHDIFEQAFPTRSSWSSQNSNLQGTNKIFYKGFIVDKFDVKQKFILAVSEPGLRRARKSTERQIKKEKEEALKKINKLKSREFSCVPDAEKECELLAKSLKYHYVQELKTEEKMKYKGRGRPSKNADKESVYSISMTLQEISNEEIEKMIWKKASFIIGTNNLMESEGKILSIYRKDQQGVERAFRFLKSPQYFADAFFFKNVKRVIALITLMTISLLVYSLLQRKLRLAIQKTGQKIPNQLGKDISNPTMNWVNQCFEGIDLIRHEIGDSVRWIFIRISTFVRTVLRLLGPQYLHRYSEKMLI